MARPPRHIEVLAFSAADLDEKALKERNPGHTVSAWLSARESTTSCRPMQC